MRFPPFFERQGGVLVPGHTERDGVIVQGCRRDCEQLTAFGHVCHGRMRHNVPNTSPVSRNLAGLQRREYSPESYRLKPCRRDGVTFVCYPGGQFHVIVQLIHTANYPHSSVADH